MVVMVFALLFFFFLKTVVVFSGSDGQRERVRNREVGERGV